MTYVTDSHSLVWFLESSARLSTSACQAIEDASAQIVVPTIVLVEIKYLYSRKRIATSVEETLRYIATATNCRIAPMDERVVERLPTTLNIHDAIIVGTALVYRDLLGEPTALITRDAEITASGLIPVVW